jgi:hypothetical protein
MAVTSYTRSDLIFQTLDNLGVLAAGQTPSSEDVSKIDKIIDASLADLTAREVVYVADAGLEGPTGGDIDPAVYLWLAAILAENASSSFGTGGDPALAAKAQAAEERLRVIGRPARTRRLLRTDHVLRRGNWPYARGNGNFTNGS